MTQPLQVRELRLQRKMTQARLARASGVEQGYISRIETGKSGPSPAVLQRLATALGVSPGALFEREGYEARILMVMERIPPDRREEALTILETISRALSKN
jgi:transcriptional regulator with XRE-family HTH domain